LSHLSIDPARLKSPELAGHKDALRFERFLAEDDPEVGEELRTAFDIFSKRVGRTAWEVQRASVDSLGDSTQAFTMADPICFADTALLALTR